MRNLWFKLLAAFFCCVAIFSAYKIFTGVKGYREAERTYEEIRQYVYMDTSEKRTEVSAAESIIEEDSIDLPKIDFAALSELSEDVKAWIYIEGTEVNYPIAQSEDNNYYLRRLLDGTYNTAGTLFLDYRNGEDFSDMHNVVYGHNMDDGSMFHTILKYKEQAFYDEHPTAYLMTPGKSYEIEFFSGYVAAASDDAWKMDFADERSFEDWINAAESKSYFESGIHPGSNDRLITLSTCSYDFNDARFVLLGVLRETEEAVSGK